MSNIYDICLIGLGPAGIGFLSSLSEIWLKNSICFEKGSLNNSCNCHTASDSSCSHCDYCNIIHGLGGASRFSCGKISGFPAGSGLESFFKSKDSLVNFMNNEINKLNEVLHLKKNDISKETVNNTKSYFKKFNIDYKYYDVYEFEKDTYIQYLTYQLKRAQDAGMQVCYRSNVTKIEKSTSTDIYNVYVEFRNTIKKYQAKKIIVATGNLSSSSVIRDILTCDIQTTYEIGVRIVIPTDKISCFLDCHGDLKLKYKKGRTYCVSKNGFVISYSIDDLLFLEGYIDKKNTTNVSNLAVIFKSDNKVALRNFMDKYRKIYNGIPIRQKYDDYLNNCVSKFTYGEKYIPVQSGNIRDLFDENINSAIIEFIDTVLIGALKLSKEDLVIYSPELKISNVINVDEDFQAEPNIYVIGAATGKFRGILQSLCSGIHCSNLI